VAVVVVLVLVVVVIVLVVIVLVVLVVVVFMSSVVCVLLWHVPVLCLGFLGDRVPSGAGSSPVVF
jgi:hypothetical protein